MTLSCMRCHKVMRLTVTAGDQLFDDDEVEVEVEIDLGTPGVLKAICLDCLSPRETWQQMMQSAAHMLDVCEEHIADMDMLFDRIPAMREQADVKAQYAKVLEQTAKARATLEVLRETEPEDE